MQDTVREAICRHTISQVDGQFCGGQMKVGTPFRVFQGDSGSIFPQVSVESMLNCPPELLTSGKGIFF